MSMGTAEPASTRATPPSSNVNGVENQTKSAPPLNGWTTVNTPQTETITNGAAGNARDPAVEQRHAYQSNYNTLGRFRMSASGNQPQDDRNLATLPSISSQNTLPPIGTVELRPPTESNLRHEPRVGQTPNLELQRQNGHEHHAPENHAVARHHEHHNHHNHPIPANGHTQPLHYQHAPRHNSADVMNGQLTQQQPPDQVRQPTTTASQSPIVRAPSLTPDPALRERDINARLKALEYEEAQRNVRRAEIMRKRKLEDEEFRLVGEAAEREEEELRRRKKRLTREVMGLYSEEDIASLNSQHPTQLAQSPKVDIQTQPLQPPPTYSTVQQPQGVPPSSLPPSQQYGVPHTQGHHREEHHHGPKKHGHHGPHMHHHGPAHGHPGHHHGHHGPPAPPTNGPHHGALVHHNHHGPPHAPFRHPHQHFPPSSQPHQYSSPYSQIPGQAPPHQHATPQRPQGGPVQVATPSTAASTTAENTPGSVTSQPEFSQMVPRVRKKPITPAWEARHGHPDSYDENGRPKWKRDNDGAYVYLTCTCGKADFKTVHGFMCHYLKKHGKKAAPNQMGALEIYGHVDKSQSQALATSSGLVSTPTVHDPSEEESEASKTPAQSPPSLTGPNQTFIYSDNSDEDESDSSNPGNEKETIGGLHAQLAQAANASSGLKNEEKRQGSAAQDATSAGIGLENTTTEGRPENHLSNTLSEAQEEGNDDLAVQVKSKEVESIADAQPSAGAATESKEEGKDVGSRRESAAIEV